MFSLFTFQKIHPPDFLVKICKLIGKFFLSHLCKSTLSCCRPTVNCLLQLKLSIRSFFRSSVMCDSTSWKDNKSASRHTLKGLVSSILKGFFELSWVTSRQTPCCLYQWPSRQMAGLLTSLFDHMNNSSKGVHCKALLWRFGPGEASSENDEHHP